MNKIKRILLCRLGGIGDVMHTLPLVKQLRKNHQDAKIEYLTSESIAKLLINCCPFIDHTWAYEKSKKKQLLAEILNSNSRIDYFFNLHGSLRFFFFNFFYIRARKLFQYKKDINNHAAINFARTYEPMVSAFSLDTKTLFIEGDSNILSSYNLKELRYLCFVPGVGKARPHRGWPIENWIKLTKSFLAIQKDFKVVFLGGKDEEGITSYLGGFNDHVLNLIGKLSLCETAKIISKATHLISCDTGLLHLASAMGVKVIGLYGPTQPERTGPFTSDYQLLLAKNCKCISNFVDLKRCKKTKELEGYCMNNIATEEVLNKLLSFTPQSLAISFNSDRSK